MAHLENENEGGHGRKAAIAAETCQKTRCCGAHSGLRHARHFCNMSVAPPHFVSSGSPLPTSCLADTGGSTVASRPSATFCHAWSAVASSSSVGSIARPRGVWASCRRTQTRIIRRHVLFVPAIRLIATENLLHCNRIGANFRLERPVLGDHRTPRPWLTSGGFRQSLTKPDSPPMRNTYVASSEGHRT